MDKVEKYKEVFNSYCNDMDGAEVDKYIEELDNLWYLMTEQEQNQIEDWNAQGCKDF